MKSGNTTRGIQFIFCRLKSTFIFTPPNDMHRSCNLDVFKGLAFAIYFICFGYIIKETLYYFEFSFIGARIRCGCVSVPDSFMCNYAFLLFHFVISTVETRMCRFFHRQCDLYVLFVLIVFLR